MVLPPPEEAAIGLSAYLSQSPGIGGKLRTEPEDFRVIELGDGPRPWEKGKFAAARVELRQWETNRFVGRAANELGIQRGRVAFAGMKDKRAVTEQWFTFQCPVDRVPRLERLDDVKVLETRQTDQRQHPGAHDGNRFVLRVRGHNGDQEAVAATIATLHKEGGVPNHFGPQRFGAGVRPITHHMGRALAVGDLEEAVRLYCGSPFEGEWPETFAARTVYEETRDPEAALAVLPRQLDHERAILQRLARSPGDYRYALRALPANLLTLFLHAHQSWAFNFILSARIEAGLGLRTAHIGDRVMASDDDGTRTHLVTAENQARIQEELDRDRAVLTAPLIGMNTEMAEGEPGAIEAKVLAELDMDPETFRCRELPELASKGRRRGILQPVSDLQVEWVEGDPVVSFALGRGAYATVVMREVMKTTLDSY